MMPSKHPTPTLFSSNMVGTKVSMCLDIIKGHPECMNSKIQLKPGYEYTDHTVYCTYSTWPTIINHKYMSFLSWFFHRNVSQHPYLRFWGVHTQWATQWGTYSPGRSSWCPCCPWPSASSPRSTYNETSARFFLLGFLGHEFGTGCGGINGGFSSDVKGPWW
jgi:hypothetical protein